jgi:hypothetical protein
MFSANEESFSIVQAVATQIGGRLFLWNCSATAQRDRSNESNAQNETR